VTSQRCISRRAATTSASPRGSRPWTTCPTLGVGFHAQQAVEKYLKAVLALNEVPVRKTHDIGALLGQLAELGLELPDEMDAALELTPYSVLERYPLARDALGPRP
jgi:HEPN domain-containing protein